MLNALWPLLKPGGRMVYATCSVLKIENTDVVAAFAAAHPDAVIADFGSATHFQLLPGQANTDGFYYACLNSGGGVDG
jgi:16S rRNA (cytosine967-C5)-methyltransferase